MEQNQHHRDLNFYTEFRDKTNNQHNTSMALECRYPQCLLCWQCWWACARFLSQYRQQVWRSQLNGHWIWTKTGRTTCIDCVVVMMWTARVSDGFHGGESAVVEATMARAELWLGFRGKGLKAMTVVLSGGAEGLEDCVDGGWELWVAV